MRFFAYLSILLVTCALVLMPATLPLAGRTLYRPKIDIKLGTFTFQRDLQFKLGLDLQGGIQVVYSADTSRIDSDKKDAALLATKDNITRRIDMLGVSEPLIQTSKSGQDYRLIVELPGVKDVNLALKTLGQTADLRFAEVKAASTSGEATLSLTNLSGSDLKQAQVQFNSSSQKKLDTAPSVVLEFTPEGAKKFADITTRIVGQPLAILLDGRLITQPPTVREPILDGRAVISGQFTLDEAKSLAVQLNAGALPLPIKIEQQRNIGATLGNQSIVKSLFAGAVGLVLVWAFMLFNYGKKGLVANFSLFLYIIISLSLFKLIPVTLTLAGMAGFILSVGMAVDANILIFERMKEETRWGRPVSTALELAFHRAWTSIRDSNISSLITASVLFWFGTGAIRGFALTLAVGIAVSLFTSITVTRNILRVVYGRVSR